jgi:hypothetical protein
MPCSVMTICRPINRPGGRSLCALEAEDSISSRRGLFQIVEQRGLYYVKQGQYDQYHGDNDQNMDPTAGAWEAGTDVSSQKAE